MSRIISPLEVVVKNLRGSVYEDGVRPELEGIVFKRKDGVMKATVCNGFVAGVAEYKDQGEDIAINILPSCYQLIKQYGITDLAKLAEIAGQRELPKEDFTGLVFEDHGKPDKDNTMLLDGRLLKKALPKARGTVYTKMVLHNKMLSLQYKIEDITFNWIVLGCRG